jgi:signal transduction histidine kinase
MGRLSPSATLTLLLLAAAGLLAIGIGVARRETSVRLERDREPVRRFSNDLQREVHRLERLYEARLTRLVRTVPLNDQQEVWRACDRIVGVRQFSLVHAARDRALDRHLPIETSRTTALPEPTLSTEDAAHAPGRLLLPEAELRDGADDTGWLDQPGQPLVFWLRRSLDEFVVLLIDEEAVTAALDTWITDWIAKAFVPVSAAGGPDQLFAPGDRLIAQIGEPVPERPDFLMPVRARFGNWQLASWDRRETRVSYHTPTLVGSGALAVLVALLGILLSAQQRRTLRHAAQRVSFVNAVSHELRAPLTNILLNVELAHDRLDDPEAVRRLDLVREESHRLARLIDNVLTFSSGNPQTGNRHACIPSRVIHAVAAQFAPSFERRALTLEYRGEVNEARLLDADALAQIIANLFSNIEKYVPGGRVEIATRLEDEVLSVVISDAGPGIPPQDAERIFRPFERLDTRVNEGSSGTGLGLAISRDLATRLGGSLGLLPSEHGAAFELRLPAPPATGITIIAAA